MTASDFPLQVRGDILTRDMHRCARPRCGRYLPEGAHLHHRKLRSQGGMGTIENGITLCGPCHHDVHMNVAAARAAGFIVPSWADPEVTPILTWRGPLLLTVDGGITEHTVATRPAEW